MIQAVLFNKKWTLINAINWLLHNKLIPIKQPHYTKNFIRFRIHSPSEFSRFFTKKLPNGIELIIGSN